MTIADEINESNGTRKFKVQGSIENEDGSRSSITHTIDSVKDAQHAKRVAGILSDKKGYKNYMPLRATELKESTSEENTVKLIDAIVDNDTIASSKLFGDAVMSRISDLIDAKRIDVAQTMFTEAKKKPVTRGPSNRTFYKEGGEAASAGKNLEDNPYEFGTAEHRYWKLGHNFVSDSSSNKSNVTPK